RLLQFVPEPHYSSLPRKPDRSTSCAGPRPITEAPALRGSRQTLNVALVQRHRSAKEPKEYRAWVCNGRAFPATAERRSMMGSCARISLQGWDTGQYMNQLTRRGVTGELPRAICHAASTIADTLTSSRAASRWISATIVAGSCAVRGDFIPFM